MTLHIELNKQVGYIMTNGILMDTTFCPHLTSHTDLNYIENTMLNDVSFDRFFANT